MIAKASGGVPRVINMICDTALVYGLAHHARKINTHIVETVLRDRKKFGLLPLQPNELPRSIRVPASLPKKKVAAHAVRSRCQITRELRPPIGSVLTVNERN